MANEIDIKINVDNTNANSGINSFKKSWTELSSAISVAKQGFEMVQQALDATVGAAVEYSNEIESLETVTQTGTVETIKLVEAADDARVSYDAVRLAAKKMVDDGLQPSVENVAALADKYNAIQDPVDRAKFAIDKFGQRAGPEMAKLLAQGSAALLASAKDVDGFASSFADNEKNLTDYKDLIDTVSDGLERFKITIGGEIAERILRVTDGLAALAGGYQILMNAINGGTSADKNAIDVQNEKIKTTHAYFNAQNQAREAIEAATDAVDEYDAELAQAANDEKIAAEAAAIRAQALKDSEEELAAAVSGPLRDAYEQYNTVAQESIDRKVELYAQLEKLTNQGYSPNSRAVKEVKAELEALNTEQQTAAEKFAQTTKEMIYQKAAADLDADAALELARSMGLVSESDYNLQVGLNKLSEIYKETGDLDGYIEAVKSLEKAAQDGSVTEGEVATAIQKIGDNASAAKSKVDDVATALDNLNGKTVSATINVSTIGGVGGESGGSGGSGTPGTGGGGGGTPGSGGTQPPRRGETAESLGPGGGALPAGGQTIIFNFYGGEAARVARAQIASIKADRINANMGG